MSTVALAGDWHGNTRWAVARIAEVAKRGVALVLHLGDFGIWPGPSGRIYLDRLEEACAEHRVGIWVTPGNHEDWGRLMRWWAETDRVAYIRTHNEWGWPDHALAYARIGAERMHQAFLGVAPPLLAHGHYTSPATRLSPCPVVPTTPRSGHSIATAPRATFAISTWPRS